MTSATKAGQESPASATDKAKPNTKNVLVIDDEPGIRELLGHELSLSGYHVMTAADGLDALALIEPGRFQLAISDINMPRLGGLDLLAALRQRDPAIEIIMVTGYATVEMAVEAMRRGAYDFVQKPFNLLELMALVEKGFEKYGLRETARLFRELEIKTQELEIAKKKLEEAQIQLIQAEKLTGIGQLASGVAHELNNPLSGIMGFSQLLLDDPTLVGQHRKDLETIHAQSQRCRAIIQNLLHFSRKKDPKKEVMDVVPVLRAAYDLMKYELSTSGTEFVLKVPASLPAVLGDPQQLQQVFLNIITNARDALEGRPGGHLEVTAAVRDRYLQIRFQDNGCGMAPEIQGKVFDPFFTTKPPGKGTGLGLSICYGIVQQHHGKLHFESKPDEGTVFTIEIPLHS